MRSALPTPAEAREQLWRQGRLRWKLFQDQKPVYDDIWRFLEDPATAYEIYYLDITRQWGKTFIGCSIGTEFGLRHPGSDIRYVSYTKEGLREFVHPNMRQLLIDCPGDIAPQWVRQEAKYHFPNGSNVHMSGANNGHEDDSRGPRAHLIIVEEAAFVDRLSYLVASVLTPQLTTTGGRILMISTPPVTPAHDVATYKEDCRLRGNYSRRTIDQNEHLTDGAKAKLIKELGGRDSTQARRELWCEWVVDSELAIIPEYTEAVDAEIAAGEPPPPTFERPTVAMDVGFEDFHFITFGYYNFRLARPIVQAEVVLQRATTDRIAYAVAATEARLWGVTPPPKMLRRHPDLATMVAPRKPALREPFRWSDTDLRLIADLKEEHDLAFSPTAKDDLEAQVNRVRLDVKERRLWVSPSCREMRTQMLVGVWKEKGAREFAKTKKHGHFDGIASLIYFIRNINRYENPYPALADGITDEGHWVPAHLRPGAESADAHTLGQLFKPKRRAS